MGYRFLSPVPLRALSLSREKKLREFCARGLSLDEISKKMDVPHAMVRVWMRMLRMRMPAQHIPLSDGRFVVTQDGDSGGYVS